MVRVRRFGAGTCAVLMHVMLPVDEGSRAQLRVALATAHVVFMHFVGRDPVDIRNRQAVEARGG